MTKRGIAATIALLAVMAGIIPLASALPPDARLPSELSQHDRTATTGSRVTRSRLTGLPTFMASGAGPAIWGSVPRRGGPPALAQAFLDDRGHRFGLRDSSDAWITQSVEEDEAGMAHARVQQLHHGVPVSGGELSMHFRGNDLVAVNARTLPVAEGFDTEPVLGATEVRQAARAWLAKHVAASKATLSAPRLEVFNRGMLDGTPRPTRLAWFVEANAPERRELIWIDARNGAVLLHFNQRADALVRAIYSADHTSSLPGRLVRSEGEPQSFDRDVDAAYDFSGDAYAYFSSEHGRDSYDDAGTALRSTVHYCESAWGNGCGCPCENAFWDGQQAAFGDGFSRADDVVVHEITHGVIENSARLFYYMQSGALTESYADIFGEVVDQTNGKGTDVAVARWFIGEDLPTTGAMRHMMDPTIFGQPAKVNDPHFVCDYAGEDNGGVHSNDGVPNHAFALMADGGSFGGLAVNGIGLRKAAKIHYRALTQYLLSAANFRDQDDALRQSCADLIGTIGITAADCTEVAAALDAVEMSRPWPCGNAQVQEPDPCPPGYVVTNVWFEDFESALPSWEESTASGPNRWSVEEVFATSGRRHLYGNAGDGVSDSAMEMMADVHLPAGSRMRFRHSYGFESDLTENYDAGVVEYTIDGGSTWVDSGNLMTAGAKYGGKISDCCGNPLAGRNAFVGDSFGYSPTLLDLSVLAGTDVRFRFRLGTDEAVGDYGWFVDDVQFYRCVAAPTSGTPGASATPTPSPTETGNSTTTPSQTFTAAPTHSSTPVASQTVAPTETTTPTLTATQTASVTQTDTATPTATVTPSLTPTSSPSATPSRTATDTPTLTPTSTSTATATNTQTSTLTQPRTATRVPCIGDCDANGAVSVNELVQGVSIALGERPTADCSALDSNSDGHVSIEELVAAVREALQGCGAESRRR
jgi:bacillolysin